MPGGCPGEIADVTADSAMITDIPSYTWSVVPALAQSGVRYFSSGPNYMPNLTDGGDRIGGALKAWGDKPFYWISPSGKEKILFWMAGRGYSWFHGLNMGELSLAEPPAGLRLHAASSTTRAIPTTWSRSATRPAATTAPPTRT